jgi:hypothetical protein
MVSAIKLLTDGKGLSATVIFSVLATGLGSTDATKAAAGSVVNSPEKTTDYILNTFPIVPQSQKVASQNAYRLVYFKKKTHE